MSAISRLVIPVWRLLATFSILEMQNSPFYSAIFSKLFLQKTGDVKLKERTKEKARKVIKPFVNPQDPT